MTNCGLWIVLLLFFVSVRQAQAAGREQNIMSLKAGDFERLDIFRLVYFDYCKENNNNNNNNKDARTHAHEEEEEEERRMGRVHKAATIIENEKGRGSTQ